MAYDNTQPLGGVQDLDKPLALPCQDQQLHILLVYIREHTEACNVKPLCCRVCCAAADRISLRSGKYILQNLPQSVQALAYTIWECQQHCMEAKTEVPGVRLDSIFEVGAFLMSGKRASGQTAQHPKGCYFWPLAGIAPINPGRARCT